MKIHLNLRAEEITLDDLVMLDDLRSGDIPGRQMRDFVARFIIGDNGGQATPEERVKIAGKLNMLELRELFEQAGQKIKELQAATVPPGRNDA